jgi:hypothetical protein
VTCVPEPDQVSARYWRGPDPLGATRPGGQGMPQIPAVPAARAL